MSKQYAKVTFAKNIERKPEVVELTPTEQGYRFDCMGGECNATKELRCNDYDAVLNAWMWISKLEFCERPKKVTALSKWLAQTRYQLGYWLRGRLRRLAISILKLAACTRSKQGRWEYEEVIDSIRGVE
jgi:hypothetical protein